MVDVRMDRPTDLRAWKLAVLSLQSLQAGASTALLTPAERIMKIEHRAKHYCNRGSVFLLPEVNQFMRCRRAPADNNNPQAGPQTLGCRQPAIPTAPLPPSPLHVAVAQSQA